MRPSSLGTRASRHVQWPRTRPVSARYEPNAPLPRFEELCRRSGGPCLWQALSWASAFSFEGFELMRTHAERRRGKPYDLVVFYRPDSVLLKPLDAKMRPGSRLFYPG